MPRQRLLRWLFELLYTRLAWAYDPVAWLVSAGQWYRWTEAALPWIEAGPVLEVGCGRGRLLGKVAARGVAVVGVDQAMQMVRHAARRSGQPVLRGDGRALPFPDGHFATIVTSFPVPYVLEAATQREFARVVRPGGQWLWVDGLALRPSAETALARLVTRAAYGPEGGLMAGPLEREESGGLWEIRLQRVAVGATTITVRVARRRG